VPRGPGAYTSRAALLCVLRILRLPDAESDIVLSVDPTTDELKVEIVDLLRIHTTRTDAELVTETGVRRFDHLRPALKALTSEGTIAKAGDVWMLASLDHNPT
jgi:hypothetical protein